MRVYPNATKSEVVGFTDEILRVKIAAPPAKGKANKELVDFLSRLLGVAKSRINIIRGQSNRNKVIAIEGLSQEELLERLSYQEDRS